MSQENVEIVRRLMRAFVEQDNDEVLRYLDPEAELDWSDSDAPDSGVYAGHAGWLAFAQARDEALGERGFEFVDLITPAPDTVVVIGRMHERGRVSGVQVAAQGAAVFTVRQGKVTHLKLYQTREQALKAVGLTE
jgi:ketosteroid isomerase-like protein